MEQKTNTPAASASKNILNSDVEVKGNLRFSGEMTFDGKLDGDVASDGTLHLGDNSVINGNINVNNVVIRGKINGNVTAREKVEIKTKTEMFGDIRASKLVIEEGVTMVGKMEVNPNKLSPTPIATTRPGETPKPPEVPKTGAR